VKNLSFLTSLREEIPHTAPPLDPPLCVMEQWLWRRIHRHYFIASVNKELFSFCWLESAGLFVRLSITRLLKKLWINVYEIFERGMP